MPDSKGTLSYLHQLGLTSMRLFREKKVQRRKRTRGWVLCRNVL